jgi:hypothetical protein
MPVYRNLSIDKMDELRDVSVQAERVYLRLAAGRFSTRTGLVPYRERDLAAEARVRPSELEAALAELVAAGHLLRARSAPAVYLLGFCSAFGPRSPDTRVSWVAELRASKYTDLALQALEEIGAGATSGRPVGNHKIPGGRPVGTLQEQDQDQDQEQNIKPPIVPQEGTELFPDEPATKKDKKATATEDKAAQLLAEYTRLCPSLPKPPPSALKTAATALKREPNLDVWLKRFARAEASDFLSGRKTEWRANVVWLLGPINCGKLDAGQYDNHKPRNGPGPGMIRTAGGWIPEPERRYDQKDELL